MRGRMAPLPSMPGAYRWYYADFNAGDTTAVFIFMLGSPFSARYAARASKGALPLSHCAVNFALYQGGVRRQWVLSEYAAAEANGFELRIGHSRLRYLEDGTVECFVRARAAPFGGTTKAFLSLRPEGPGLEEGPLLKGLSHTWGAVALRARATLRLPVLGTLLEGSGYHDTNAGEVPLGTDLPRWSWARAHGPDATHVLYGLPSGERLLATGTASSATLQRLQAESPPSRLTGWGLRVPRALGDGTVALSEPRLLESSPFYARLEATGTGVHALAEGADFHRFRSPLVRWMARVRTRVEAA
jgi:carotenoid 1,2-hydratase